LFRGNIKDFFSCSLPTWKWGNAQDLNVCYPGQGGISGINGIVWDSVDANYFSLVLGIGLREENIAIEFIISHQNDYESCSKTKQ
jgi:hypothetical protein